MILLTSNNIGISVPLQVICFMGVLSSKLVQTTCCSNLLIFLGKPYFLIHVKINDMFRENMNRNGMKRLFTLSRVPATKFYLMFGQGGAVVVVFLILVAMGSVLTTPSMVTGEVMIM